MRFFRCAEGWADAQDFGWVFSPCVSPFCVCRCSDYLFKLLLIGDSGVGKSCLLLRFAVRGTAVIENAHHFIRWG